MSGLIYTASHKKLTSRGPHRAKFNTFPIAPKKGHAASDRPRSLNLEPLQGVVSEPAEERHREPQQDVIPEQQDAIPEQQHGVCMEPKQELSGERRREIFTSPQTFTIYNQLQRTLFSSWVNVLLLLAPAAIALHIVKGDSVETFAVSFVATIPFQFLAENGLDEIQLRLGQTYSSLLYISTW